MTPREVLSFWIGAPAVGPAELEAKMVRAFRGGAAFDEEVRERFGATVEAAQRGELDGWSRTLEGRLALVIVLDQLARNVYRDDPRAYAGDSAAIPMGMRETYVSGRLLQQFYLPLVWQWRPPKGPAPRRALDGV